MGLLDNVLSSPSDQALWALGSGLLGVRRGREGTAFQQALEAYNQAQQEMRRNKLTDSQLALHDMQVKAMQQQMAEADKIRGVYSDPANYMKSPQSAFPPNEMDWQGSPAAAPTFNQKLLAESLMKTGTLAGAKEGISLLQKDDKETVVAPGATVLKGGVPVFRAPDKPEAMPEVIRLAAMRDSLPAAHPWRKMLDDMIGKLTTHAPAAVQNNFAEGEKGYKHSRDLANDFKQEPIYKAHSEVTSAYRQIMEGLKAESPAGDLTAATKFMKIIDPNSVVRESELAMAMAATGLGDRITNYVQMIVSGTKLTPAQRRDFRNVATRLYEESDKLYRAKQGQYATIAKDNKLDGRMLGNVDIPKPAVPQTVDDLVNLYTQEGQ